MLFDKALVQESLLSWGKILQSYALPAWEDFPALPLYMDQVIYLINGYLALISPEAQEDKIVTPAMINNYVKLKIIPAPVKKRYGRMHLAYLVMVCILKQCMNTAEIKKLMPIGQPEDAVRALYGAFVHTVADIRSQFCQVVHQAAEPVLAPEGPPVTHLVFQMAVAANLFRASARQIIALQGTDAPSQDAPPHKP